MTSFGIVCLYQALKASYIYYITGELYLCVVYTLNTYNTIAENPFIIYG